MAIGSYFFLYFERDFELGSAKGLFYDRKFSKLCLERNFDPAKVDFLEKYVTELRQQMNVLTYEE
jgi:hypothetical protein